MATCPQNMNTPFTLLKLENLRATESADLLSHRSSSNTNLYLPGASLSLAKVKTFLKSLPHPAPPPLNGAETPRVSEKATDGVLAIIPSKIKRLTLTAHKVEKPIIRIISFLFREITYLPGVLGAPASEISWVRLLCHTHTTLPPQKLCFES